MSGILKKKVPKGKAVDLSGKKLSALSERLKADESVDSLDVSNNFLRSVSLAEVVAALPNLTALDLSKNALTTLPSEIGQLSRLIRLNVSHNALTELPASLGELVELRKLSASRNALRSLPASLGALKQLNSLQLADNALTELPPWLLGLRDSLKELAVDGNPLLAPSALFLGKDALSSSPSPLLWACLERLAALRALHYDPQHFALTPAARRAFAERLASDSRAARLFAPVVEEEGRGMWCALSYSISQQQNWRAYQEDRFVCIPQVDLADVLSDRLLPTYYPPLWDDQRALYEKEVAIHRAIMAEYEREANGENVDEAKDKWLRERERQRKELHKARKEGAAPEERDEAASLEEQSRHIARVDGWHRILLEPQYPLHLDARSSPYPKRRAHSAAPTSSASGEGDERGERETKDRIDSSAKDEQPKETHETKEKEGKKERKDVKDNKEKEIKAKEGNEKEGEEITERKERESTEIKEVESEDRKETVAATRGKVAASSDSVGFFAVFDGHGGDHCSDYLQHNMHVHLFNNKARVRAGEWSAALREAFETSERLFMAECRARNFTSGSTAVVALLVNTTLWVANCGDSRAVLCRRDKAKDLSRDHKPSLKDEKKRIEDVGGFIESSAKTGYTSRVMGILAMTRSIGDIQCKEPVPAVSAEPEITETLLGPDDAFFLIASDGLFDAMTSQDAVDYVRKSTERHRVAQELAERALRDSKDNVTVMIVWLFWGADGPVATTTHGSADAGGIVLGKDRVTSEVLASTKRARSVSQLSASSTEADAEGPAEASKPKSANKEFKISKSSKSKTAEEVKVKEGHGSRQSSFPTSSTTPEVATLPDESATTDSTGNDSEPEQTGAEGKTRASSVKGQVERRHSVGSLTSSPKSKSSSKDKKRMLVTSAGGKSKSSPPLAKSAAGSETKEETGAQTPEVLPKL